MGASFQPMRGAADLRAGNGFWDNDVWAMLALLPLWPDLADAGAAYRRALAPAAAAHAAASGYRGMYFPWQTAGTGREVDLASIVNKDEIHVSGAVVLLMHRLADATGDPSALAAAAPVAAGVATFYASRATRAKDGRLSLDRVVPPDEFAIGWPTYSGVRDSVYTNAIAVLAARFAARANPQHPDRSSWEDLAANLTMLSDGEGGSLVHPEYEGFPAANRWFGGKVKQADVTMLPYPLQDHAHVTAASARNDLRMYEPLYDPAGPAMTESVGVIGWLAVDAAANASRQLWRSMLNMQPPFHVWTESKTPHQHVTIKDQGCFNFVTGAGGFTQSIIAGYGGVRFMDGSAELRPRLPPGASLFRLRGLAYHGARFSVSVSAATLKVCLRVLGARQPSGFTATCADGCAASKNMTLPLHTVGSCASFATLASEPARLVVIPASSIA